MERENALCIHDQIIGRLFTGGGNWNSVYFLCLVLGSAELCVMVVTENSLDFKMFYLK